MTVPLKRKCSLRLLLRCRRSTPPYIDRAAAADTIIGKHLHYAEVHKNATSAEGEPSSGFRGAGAVDLPGGSAPKDCAFKLNALLPSDRGQRACFDCRLLPAAFMCESCNGMFCDFCRDQQSCLWCDRYSCCLLCVPNGCPVCGSHNFG